MDTSVNGNLFEKLFLTCSVYRLRVSISGMTKKLKPQDLGLNEDEIPSSDLITLGNKRLIPKEEIDKLVKIRHRAYKAIEGRSLKFTFGSFVPKSQIEDLDEVLNSLKIEFETAVNDMGSRYDELRQSMMNRWNEEMISVADKNGKDEEFIFAVMSRIENAFKPWDQVRKKFDFTWKTYTEINDIARSFIESVSIGMADKMKEFAESFILKIEEGNLKESNLKSARKLIEDVRMSMEVFQSNTLTSVLDDLEEWTLHGTANDVSASKALSDQMSSAMSGIVEKCNNRVDDIVRESVDSISAVSASLDL